jgi:hypothetical protein
MGTNEKLSLKDRLSAAALSLRNTVPQNMKGGKETTSEETKVGNKPEEWAEVAKKAKPKTYTEAPVAMGDHILIARGHNDTPAAIQQGLTNSVVWDVIMAFLDQNVGDLGLTVKAVTMTEKDTQLSPNAAKKRWAKAKGKGKPPLVQMRVFAIQIGFAEDTDVAWDDERLIIEILDNLCRKRAYESIETDSPWPEHLDVHLSPVKAMRPKPVAILFGLNPATHGADACTCLDINHRQWVAYKDMLTGANKSPTFMEWHKQFGIKASSFQGITRYHVYAADMALKTVFHQTLKTADHKIIKLKNLIVEYVDNVQKGWKSFLLTGMATYISQSSLDALVVQTPLLKAISYKASLIRETASAMIYVGDPFATIDDVYGTLPAHYSTPTAQMTYPKGVRSPSMSAATATGRAIGATRTSAGGDTTPRRQVDDTASFREDMGLQDPQGALTMEELMDHEGEVWVVLKQHNRSARSLLAVFGCPLNAQFYAKTHRGFQKKFDSVTDMMEDTKTRGVMTPLKTAYYHALGKRATNAGTPSTPERRHKGKRSRVLSPGGGQVSEEGDSTGSTLSTHGVLPEGDLFSHMAANNSTEWTFQHIDPQTASNIAGLCPDAYLEELRALMGIITDPDIAITQVMAWRQAQLDIENV